MSERRRCERIASVFDLRISNEHSPLADLEYRFSFSDQR
jgi:hypothetical protein